MSGNGNGNGKRKLSFDALSGRIVDDNFCAWKQYFGMLLSDGDSRFPSEIYGFENLTPKAMQVGSDDPVAKGIITLGHSYKFQKSGALYGFVVQGSVGFYGHPRVDGLFVSEMEWFCLANAKGRKLELSPDTKVVIVQRLDFLGITQTGGPIETKGRLRYIDKCSDTLLVGPPLMGDPCFNHLHFPPGILQSEHTHPSTRAGIVAKGRGWCLTPRGDIRLESGLVFHIPRNGLHSFKTEAESMDVIAYHPDSDFGPTHENHPMVNRTLVSGEKIDNTKGVHLEADVIVGEGGAS